MVEQMGRVLINGIPYIRPVVTVAKVRFDGSGWCVIPVGDLMDMLEDGQEYTVKIETMSKSRFERLPEFTGF